MALIPNFRFVAAAVAAVVVSAGVLADTVTVKGSDTMLVLNQRWSEAFGKSHPDSTIAVTGGGSSLGIEAFIEGDADICAASRPLRKTEIDAARSRGAVANRIAVALDGLAIAVHPANPVKSITMDDLRGIYTGRIRNWRQLGGSDLPIVPLSRDLYSGTHSFFQHSVLRDQDWAPSVRFLNSTPEIVTQVSRLPGAIGFGGVGYFGDKSTSKLLAVAPRTGAEPVPLTEEAVRSKKYPIWRHLYFYTNGRPKGSTQSFIDFCLSEEGQRIAEEVGYFSLR